MAKVQVACLPCRRRKIRCDGGNPCCNCRARAISLECEYKENTPPGMLSRGSACIPCRRRKKKCDARKPSCSTCSNPNSCIYDADGQWIPSPATRTQRECSSDTQGISTSALLANDHNRRSPTLSIRTFFTGSTLVFQHRILSPRNSVVQYSTIFFTHRLQLGFSFSEAKVEAIKDGDLSSQFVHPSLVHIAHMWGSVFWQRVNLQCEDDELSFFRLALESLEGSSCRPPEPVEAVQAQYLLSIYCFMKREPNRGHRLHISACKVVADHQLHISHSNLSTNSIFDIEQMQAVCYLLLSDYSPIPPFQMESKLSTRLVHELESVVTICPDLDICIMQTAATVLHQRAFEHANELPKNAVDPSSTWLDRQCQLSSQIYRYMGIVQSSLLRTSFVPFATLDVLGLKQCIIILLAGHVTLFAPLAGQHAESARKSYLAALQIADMSSSFSFHEFYFLHPTVMFGWKLAADIFTGVQRRSIQVGPVSSTQLQLLTEKLIFLQECKDNLLQATPWPIDGQYGRRSSAY